MTDILEWCKAEGRSFVEYVELHEGPEIFDYLEEVWKDVYKRQCMIGRL